MKEIEKTADKANARLYGEGREFDRTNGEAMDELKRRVERGIIEISRGWREMNYYIFGGYNGGYDRRGYIEQGYYDIKNEAELAWEEAGQNP